MAKEGDGAKGNGGIPNINFGELNPDTIQEFLDSLYKAALDGVPMVSKPIEELASDYSSKHKDNAAAARALANAQIVKCGTSGFVTGLGGLITLPVAIPANVASVMYVQLRMVAAIAVLGGYDTHSDQVQTLAYVCLTGQGAADILKEAGIKFGEKIAENAIKKIPGAVFVKINQKVGFRFITKFGEKGLINLGKMLPLVGGVIGGGFDVASTRIIADNALKTFIGV